MVKQCIRRIVEQEKGIYNWDGMLKEARSGKTDSDHADYVGPIEVRVCENSKCGRGLFVTRDVEPGELLLVEKAFSAAFVKQVKRSERVEKPARNADGGAAPQLEKDEEKAREKVTALQAGLTSKTLTKLILNSSLQPAFLDLHPGLNINKKVNKPESLGDAVQSRLELNAFAFPLHSIPRPSLASRPSTNYFSRGIWIRASYVNHTCNPTVRRSFMSDFIILRAQSHIRRDTEIRLDYVSCLMPVSQRRQLLSHYGFHCECERCVSEAETPQRALEARQVFSEDFKQLMLKQDSVEWGVCLITLMAIDGTYKAPSSVEPKLALVSPLLSLILAANAADEPFEVMALTCRLLDALGFELEHSETEGAEGEERFAILRWGFLIEETLLMMMNLVHAFEASGHEGWRRGAEKEAKKCHLIMNGEDASWELGPAV